MTDETTPRATFRAAFYTVLNDALGSKIEVVKYQPPKPALSFVQREWTAVLAMFEACRQSQAQNYKVVHETSDSYSSSMEECDF